MKIPLYVPLPAGTGAVRCTTPVRRAVGRSVRALYSLSFVKKVEGPLDYTVLRCVLCVHLTSQRYRTVPPDATRHRTRTDGDTRAHTGRPNYYVSCATRVHAYIRS